MSTISPHPIQAFREREGLSREGLAQQLGVDRVTVFRWETGRRNIGRRLWSKIIEVTGLPEAQIAGVEQMERSN